MYYQLAHLYDWPGALEFTEKIMARDTACFERAGIRPPARIIDLACGTGTQSVALAKLGYDVLGLDLSLQMLALAEDKRAVQDPQRQWRLEFRSADMRMFLLPETETPADAVLCHHDSLNHLSNETELRATFLHVAQALRSGGLFLFDLNTLENFETFWNGSDTYEGANYRLKTTASFNPDSAQATVEFDVDEYTEDGRLVSRNERVVERYFHEAAVEKYLMAAGFSGIRYEPFTPVDAIPSDVPLKTYWQAVLTDG